MAKHKDTKPLSHEAEAGFRVDPASCTARVYNLDHGIWQITLFDSRALAPAGHVWFVPFAVGDAGKAMALVIDSFVTEWARRQGVRTRLNEEIARLTAVQVVLTPNSTESGRAFMEATGYQLDKDTGLWFLNVAPDPVRKPVRRKKRR